MSGTQFMIAGLPGGWEWIIVLLAILLLFGRRIPGIARSLGQGINSFKKGLNDPVEEGKQEDGGEKSDNADSRTAS